MLIVLAYETHFVCLLCALLRSALIGFCSLSAAPVPGCIDTISPTHTLFWITRAARRYWSTQFGHIFRIVQITARPVRSARPFTFHSFRFSVAFRSARSQYAPGTSICIELVGPAAIDKRAVCDLCDLRALNRPSNDLLTHTASPFINRRYIFPPIAMHFAQSRLPSRVAQRGATFQRFQSVI